MRNKKCTKWLGTVDSGLYLRIYIYTPHATTNKQQLRNQQPSAITRHGLGFRIYAFVFALYTQEFNNLETNVQPRAITSPRADGRLRK